MKKPFPQILQQYGIWVAWYEFKCCLRIVLGSSTSQYGHFSMIWFCITSGFKFWFGRRCNCWNDSHSGRTLEFGNLSFCVLSVHCWSEKKTSFMLHSYILIFFNILITLQYFKQTSLNVHFIVRSVSIRTIQYMISLFF